jgi:hypothetical protein
MMNLVECLCIISAAFALAQVILYIWDKLL